LLKNEQKRDSDFYSSLDIFTELNANV